MKTLLFGLILISPPFLKGLWLKWFCAAKIGRGVHIGWFAAVIGRHIELGDNCVIRPCTLINLAGDVRLGPHSEISSFTLVYGSASLSLGAGSYVGPQCLINVDEPVVVGQGSALGARCMVFTHGSFLPFMEGYWVKLAGVTLGNRVWCAAGVFLHPGVEIEDDSFVNSCSVVTRSVPAGSVVEGNPAKVVYPMERLKRKMSPRYVDLAMEQILRGFAEIGLRRELGVTTIEATQRQLDFQWRGQAYRVVLIPSTAEQPEPDRGAAGMRQIFVVNQAHWAAPQGAMVFEVATRHTSVSSDPIHTALRLFMLRYYGERFTHTGQN